MVVLPGFMVSAANGYDRRKNLAGGALVTAKVPSMVRASKFLRARNSWSCVFPRFFFGFLGYGEWLKVLCFLVFPGISRDFPGKQKKLQEKSQEKPYFTLNY